VLTPFFCGVFLCLSVLLGFLLGGGMVDFVANFCTISPLETSKIYDISGIVSTLNSEIENVYNEINVNDQVSSGLNNVLSHTQINQAFQVDIKEVDSWQFYKNCAFCCCILFVLIYLHD
jgi:hypothetical protein